MIKKLRLKFVCVIMVIVMFMLGIILGVVIHFTGQNMQMQSVNMMRTIAAAPFSRETWENRPMTRFASLTLPYRSAAGAI